MFLKIIIIIIQPLPETASNRWIFQMGSASSNILSLPKTRMGQKLIPNICTRNSACLSGMDWVFNC